jgi:hypothetical protein
VAEAVPASAFEASKSVLTGPITPAPGTPAPGTSALAMPASVTPAPGTPAPIPVPDDAGASAASDDPGGPDDCQNVLSCGGCCGPAGRFWFQADCLLWWAKGTALPPLVTTSGTAQGGALVPGTTVLFGGDSVENRARFGADITLGMWLDPCQNWGIEGTYFDLGRQSAGFENCLSNGNPVLARPFTDTTLVTSGPQPPPFPNAELIAYPPGAAASSFAGRVIASASDYFQTAGLHFRHNLCCWECCCGEPECGDSGCGCPAGCDSCCRKSFKLDVIGGYRYYDLSDNVAVQEQLVALTSPVIPVGTQFNVTDSFRARNSFNGTELGLIADYAYCRWSWELSAKMSLGWNHDVVNINGATTFISPSGVVNTAEGGLLALDTNIGGYSRDYFVVIPEFGLQVGYQCTQRLRVFFGYDFLYWTWVARAADQINLNINTNNIPSPPGSPPPPGPTGGNPTPYFNTTGFWAQGIRLGAEYRF